MAEIVSLLRNVLDLDSDTKVLRCYLNSCSEQLALLDPSKVPSIVSLINTKLNEPSSRYDGLLLLLTFLPQCSSDVLASNASTWMQLCLKGITVPQTSPIAFDVLKTFFKFTRELPEMTKIVSASIVPSLAEQINREVFSQGLLPALKCLEECFDKYNGPCGPHKKVWERFLIPLVDYSGPQTHSVRSHAARCIALLPQTGGGGTGGTMYACAWWNQQNVLCRSIHVVLDDLFADVTEVQVFQADDTFDALEPLPLPELRSSNPICRVQILTIRLSGLITFLQAMLLGKFPVPKKIALSSLLNLICRGLAVNKSSFNFNTTTHSLALVSVLPEVHVCLLNLLNTLIVVCRSNLLPFAGLVCKLAVQTLKWTHVEKWTYGTEKPYRSLRIQAYKLVTHWCGMAKRGSLIENVADQLTEMAVQDSFMERDVIALSSELARRNKYANRKHTKQMAATVHSNSGLPNGHEHHATGRSVCITANENLCIAALQAMRSMLTSASSTLSPSVHKILQESVGSALVDITRDSSNPPIPFSSSCARQELYQTLLALVLNPHTVMPPPLGLALKLFACGLNDRDLQISVFCTTALSCLEKIVHPSHASLHFQVPLEDTVSIVWNSQKQNTPVKPSSIGTGMSEDESDESNIVTLNNSQDSAPTESTSPKKSLAVSLVDSNCSPSKILKSTISEEGKVPHSKASVVEVCLSDKGSDVSEANNDVLKTPIVEVASPSVPNDNHCIEIDSNETSEENTNSGARSEEDREMIDLADSASEPDDTEAPSEINIAESEDEMSSFSKDSCVSLLLEEYRTTVGGDERRVKGDNNASSLSPVREVESETQTTPQKATKTSPTVQTSKPENDSDEVQQVVDESHYSPQKENGKCLLVSDGNESPIRAIAESSNDIILTPRVLRSRTISNSSNASTPGKKRTHRTIPLAPTVEEHEEASSESPKREDSNEELQSKKLKLKFEEDELDDKLDAMLSSFVDVTQRY